MERLQSLILLFLFRGQIKFSSNLWTERGAFQMLLVMRMALKVDGRPEQIHTTAAETTNKKPSTLPCTAEGPINEASLFSSVPHRCTLYINRY